MASVSLNQIRKSFGAVEVLRGIDLDIKKGEFIVFVGPSGCGKSTMLRIIAGLEETSGGTLRIGDEVMNNVPPGERGIAMVFQSYALYPHMSVYDNMAFGLKVAGMEKAQIDKRVRHAAGMLQLTPYLDRRPRNLSGGQRQRVAIGRAVTRDPQVFLFDEPLSNLDAALRVATRVEIANLHESMPEATMIYVTHDQVEAMTLADRIVVFNAGKIEQIGTPMDLYDTPENLFVARFIGSPEMNILPAEIGASDNGPVLSLRSTLLKTARDAEIAERARGGKLHVGIRPEHLHQVEPSEARLSGPITHIERLGEVTNVHIDIGEAAPLTAKLPGSLPLRRGDQIGITFDNSSIHFFDADGKRI